MEFIINGFLACIGAVAALSCLYALWLVWPYLVIVFLRFVTTKEWQAKMVDDLKKDRGWNAYQSKQILRTLRAVRWNENKES
jgi:hypothetical protein